MDGGELIPSVYIHTDFGRGVVPYPVALLLRPSFVLTVILAGKR